MADYADAPQSISEIRANKENDCSLWSPRDVLIDTLRKIDSGEIKPDRLMVIFREGEPHDPETSWVLSNHDILITWSGCWSGLSIPC